MGAGNGSPQVERDPLLAAAGVMHGFTGRRGGVSLGPYASLNLGFHVGDDPEAVRENRRRSLEALGLGAAQLVLGEQVHGTRLRNVGPAERGAGMDDLATALPGTDGLVTTASGIVLGVLVADCIPLLLADPEARVVAAVHAGWRGTVAGIAARAVEEMVAQGARPPRIVAAMGPSIGPCCYQVSPELAARFGQLFGDEVVRSTPTGPRLDLRGSNRIQLLEAGVREENISWQPACTACAHDRYFSHRAQRGEAGRGAGYIWQVD